MATYYFTGGISDAWGVAGNWSTTSGGIGDGAVPTSTDDVYFDSNSPNCNMGGLRQVRNIIFTGSTGGTEYVNTIDGGGPLAFGSVLLSSGGTFNIYIYMSLGNLLTYGHRISFLSIGRVSIGNVTLLDDVYCDTFQFSSANAVPVQLNGFTVTTSFVSLGSIGSGNYTYGYGTTKFILVGKAQISYSIVQLGILGNTIEIDCEEITFPRSLRFGYGTVIKPQIIYKKGLVKGLVDLVCVGSVTLNDMSVFKELVSIRCAPNTTLTLNYPLIGHPLKKISVLATSTGTFFIDCTKRFVNRYVRIKDARSSNTNNKIFIGENKYNESTNFAESFGNDFIYRMNEIPNGVPTTPINNDPMLENKDYRSFDPMFTIR